VIKFVKLGDEIITTHIAGYLFNMIHVQEIDTWCGYILVGNKVYKYKMSNDLDESFAWFTSIHEMIQRFLNSDRHSEFIRFVQLVFEREMDNGMIDYIKVYTKNLYNNAYKEMFS